jgi:hypothetical protein
MWVLIILFIYFANCIFYQLNDVFNLFHSQTLGHYNLLPLLPTLSAAITAYISRVRSCLAEIY